MDATEVYARLIDYETVARSRGVNDPEEVADRVAVRLWTRLAAGDDVNRRLEGLVLHGQITDALRSQDRVLVTSRPLPPGPIPVPDLDDALFASALRETLISTYPVEAKAWALTNINGLTQREAATELGISQQRVAVLAERCRQRLERRLS